MARPVSVGYLTAQPTSVGASEWLVTPTGLEPLANPTHIPNWQYSTDLSINRTLTVDTDELRQATRLESADEIRCLITWTSSATGLQGASEPRTVDAGANHVCATVPGTETGGFLLVQTTISTVPGPTASRSPLAAHRSGSTLWSDEIRIELEGDISRFPTEALSFDATGLGGPQEASALSCVRILLNTDNEVYRRLTETPYSPEAQVTQRFLAYEVARQLVVAALAQGELSTVDYESGSLGNVLRARLRDYFAEEGDAIEPLRSRWTMFPSDIDAELQRYFQL